MDAKPVKLHASLSFVRRRIAGKLCPMYSHSPLYSVTYYVGRVEGEAGVQRVRECEIQYTTENEIIFS